MLGEEGDFRPTGRRLLPWLTLALGLTLGGPIGGFARREAGSGGGSAQPQRSAEPAQAQGGEPAAVRPLPPAESKVRPSAGRITVQPIWLSAPDDLIRAEDCKDRLYGPWVLGTTPEGLSRLLGAAQLPAEQSQALLRTSQCDPLPSGRSICMLRPDLPLVASLSRHARTLLYSELARFEQNEPQFYAYRFSPAAMEDWLANAEFPRGVAEKLRQLTYQTGETVQFADPPLLCQGRTPAERTQIWRSLSQTPSLIATLHVPEGADVEPLVRYWGVGGREPRVRPLLQALSRRPGGYSIDISHLFPPFARQRIYRYPTPDAPGYNCHWTAFNFFENGKPDDRLLQGTGGAVIREKYLLLDDQPLQFGDVISFFMGDAGAVHSVVYIADNLVFGKGGLTHLRPWVLTSLTETRKQYRDLGATEVHLRHRDH